MISGTPKTSKIMAQSFERMPQKLLVGIHILGLQVVGLTFGASARLSPGPHLLEVTMAVS